MKTKPIDLTKPVTTRDGRQARVTCTDRLSATGYTLQALVMGIGGKDEHTGTYLADGSYYADRRRCPSDLINVPVVRKGWVNVYANGKGMAIHSAHPTRESADTAGTRSGGRIACVEIEITEGEGLD